MKDKFFSKIVKKDYNNILEEILSNKNYSEDVKNSLLSIFYNIENGYDDYSIVKRETLDKDEYIESLMNIIQNACNSIVFLKRDDDKEIIDKEKKEIKCFPTQTNILYSILKIRNRSININYLDESIEKSLFSLLDIGNNLNYTEPLRDFNGFSWNTGINEINNIRYNLIYQNLIFIAGNYFLEEWINNFNDNINYFDLFIKKLELKYGKKNSEKLIDNLAHIAILIKVSYEDEFRNYIIEKSRELQFELKNMENKENYLNEISKIKKLKQKEIRNLDKIINDKNLLKLEYEKKNKNLSKDKKIFSIRVLKNILIEERKEKLAEIENLNKKMEPKYFLRLREYITRTLNIININNKGDIDNQINTSIVEFQKEIIKIMYIDINKIYNKEQLINYIYIYRYYNLLSFSDKNKIGDVKEIKEELNKIAEVLFNKALEMKVIIKIYNDNEENINILKNIFITRIITLEDIYIKINSEQLVLTMYDEEIEECKIKLKNELKPIIKLNKKIKLFI